jgi:hypothetical protein
VRVRRVLTLSCALSLCVALPRAQAQASRRLARKSTPAPRPPAPVPAAAPAPEPIPPGVQYGVRIDPDTVTVGLPFQVLVRVRAPLGTRIVLPAGPDSGGSVEALDTRRLQSRSDSSAMDVSAVYRLAAWDVGRLPLSLGSITVTDGTGTHAISLGSLAVVVMPTMTARGNARTPRPARDYYADRQPWWWRWAILGAAVIVLLVGWLIVRWWRRRSRRPAPPLGALGVAEQELDHLEHLGLVDAGEWGRYVALVAETLRRFLARRLPQAPLSSTSGELVAALGGDPRVPIDRVRDLLTQTDYVKFAGHPLSKEVAQQATDTTRTLMRDIDAAVIAAEVATREETARQVSRELEERRTARAVGTRGRAA